jgi:hypothetical protein
MIELNWKMVSNIERVQQGLQKFKALGDGPESLDERTRTMRNVMVGLTNFDNIPPCVKADPKECILARKYIPLCPHKSLTKNF